VRPFDIITFDCYGMLIGWEAGITKAFQGAAAADGVSLGRRRRAWVSPGWWRASCSWTRPRAWTARAQLVGRLLRILVLVFVLWLAIEPLDFRGPDPEVPRRLRGSEPPPRAPSS
jgi:hypothetical protein